MGMQFRVARTISCPVLANGVFVCLCLLCTIELLGSDLNCSFCEAVFLNPKYSLSF